MTVSSGFHSSPEHVRPIVPSHACISFPPSQLQPAPGLSQVGSQEFNRNSSRVNAAVRMAATLRLSVAAVRRGRHSPRASGQAVRLVITPGLSYPVRFLYGHVERDSRVFRPQHSLGRSPQAGHLRTRGADHPSPPRHLGWHPRAGSPQAGAEPPGPSPRQPDSKSPLGRAAALLHHTLGLSYAQVHEKPGLRKLKVERQGESLRKLAADWMRTLKPLGTRIVRAGSGRRRTSKAGGTGIPGVSGVGAVRIELTTNGLRVHCSTS
jgi:hypothetical protein